MNNERLQQLLELIWSLNIHQDEYEESLDVGFTEEELTWFCSQDGIDAVMGMTNGNQ